MKIKKIEIYKINIPWLHPFTVSSWHITEKASVIAKIYTDNGIIGYGEASCFSFPFYKYETSDTAYLALEKYIAPLLINKDLPNAAALMDQLKMIKGHNFAKTALENAFCMARSIEENKSIKELIGGVYDTIEVGESLGIREDISDTLAEVDQRLQEGFKRIKVKIAPGWDVRVVEAIRKEFGDIPLMVDANSAYTLADMQTLKKLDEYNLTMIEQPLADDDIVDHATLQSQIQTPLCLDESITSPDDARKAMQIGSCKIINIKQGRVGGVVHSTRIHDNAIKDDNLSLWGGGMFETTIGRAFNIILASLPQYTYPADMSTVHEYFADDLTTDSYSIKNGVIDVPNTPGIGFEVDDKKLLKYTTQKVVITK